MNKATFKDINPVLPVKDVSKAVHYYSQKLGFTLMGQDNPDDPKYAVIKRDTVELHLQWHDPETFSTAIDKPSLRFVIDDVDALFEEYQDKAVFHELTDLRDTAWGTREFAFFDADGNGLTFYKDL